jgi:sugar phosphate isomerase/epimerase
MIMKNPKPGNSITRRQFIGNIMLATTSAAIITGCKTSAFSRKNTSGWQIGAYTRAWGNNHYLVALDGMVEAGYKFAGLSTHEGGRVVDRETSPEVAAGVGEEIKKRGLKLVTLSGGSFDPAKPVNEGIVQLKRLIDNSVSCGSPNIQINDVSQPELISTFYKVIAECCDYASDKGVRITVKPHGSSGAECRTRIEKIGHENLKLWYDPGNVYFYTHGELDPVDDAAGIDGVVVGMAVKDFRLPRDVNVTPGTGMVDFPKLMARLQQGGFTEGPLIVECLNVGDVPYITSEARKAREFLEKITT